MSEIGTAFPSLQRMAANSAVALVGKVATRAFGLGTWLLLTWLLGTRGYGLYAFALTYVGFFAAFGDAGLNTVLTREFARSQGNTGKILGAGLAVSVIISTVTWMMALAVAQFLPQDTVSGQAGDLILIHAFSLLALWGTVFDALFRARLMMYVSVLVNTVRYAVYFVFILGLVYGGLEQAVALKLAVLAWLALAVAAAVVHALVGLRLARPTWPVDWSVARTLLVAAAPLWLARMAIVTYYWVDTLMLGALIRDEHAVGLYSAARKFPEALALIPAALLDSVYPVLSRLAAERRDRLAGAVARCWVLLLWLALPAAVLGCGFADVLFLILPEAFREGRGVTWPFMWLVWAHVFVSLNMLCYSLLNATDNQARNLFITSIMMVFNVTLNVPLILHFHERGAAVATLATEMLGLMLELYFVSRVLGAWFPWRGTGWVLVGNALLLAGMVTYLALASRSLGLDAAAVIVLLSGYLWLGLRTGCLEPAVWRELMVRRG